MEMFFQLQKWWIFLGNKKGEKEFGVTYKDQLVGKFRCDLFIENKVIVELKSVTGYLPALFKSQLLHI